MKNLKEMNVRDLQTYIRGLTQKANQTIETINKQPKVSRAVQRELQTLEKYGYLNKQGKAKLGFRGKTKQALVQQARELEYFSQWKGTETRARRDKANRLKYKAFVQNNPQFSDYSYEDWRELVEIMGSADNLLESFGYEDLKQLHKETTKKNIDVNFAEKMREAIKLTKGQGADRETLIDVFRSLIFK